jgi:hypothetical protein
MKMSNEKRNTLRRCVAAIGGCVALLMFALPLAASAQCIEPAPKPVPIQSARPEPVPLPSGDSETDAVWGEPGTGADAGKLKGGCFDDVETNTRCDPATSGVSFDFPAATQPNPGLVQVHVVDAGGTREGVMATNQVSNKYLVVGINKGGDPMMGHLEPSLFLAVEQ